MKRVVVTGIGIIAPSGVGKEAFWRNNTAGVREELNWEKEGRVLVEIFEQVEREMS